MKSTPRLYKRDVHLLTVTIGLSISYCNIVTFQGRFSWNEEHVHNGIVNIFSYKTSRRNGRSMAFVRMYCNFWSTGGAKLLKLLRNSFCLWRHSTCFRTDRSSSKTVLFRSYYINSSFLPYYSTSELQFLVVCSSSECVLSCMNPFDLWLDSQPSRYQCKKVLMRVCTEKQNFALSCSTVGCFK